jgi:hypothetical protein
VLELALELLSDDELAELSDDELPLSPLEDDELDELFVPRLSFL